MNIIKAKRIETGLSQACFCEKAGLHLQTYQRIEQNGSSLFSLRASTLYAIAKALDVTSEFLIDYQIKQIVCNLDDVTDLAYVTHTQIADVCSKEELQKYYKKYQSNTIKKAIDECIRRTNNY